MSARIIVLGRYLRSSSAQFRRSLGTEWRRDRIFFKIFKLLLRALRFDDIRTRDNRKQTDKLAPITSIFKQFVQKCKEIYVPSEFVTIDEMLDFISQKRKMLILPIYKEQTC